MKKIVLFFLIVTLATAGYLLYKSIWGPYSAIEREFGLSLEKNKFEVHIDTHESTGPDFERLIVLGCKDHLYLKNLQKQLITNGYNECNLNVVHYTGEISKYFPYDRPLTIKVVDSIDASGYFTLCVVDTQSFRIGFYQLQL